MYRLCLIALGITASVVAQTATVTGAGTIQGSVVDATTNKPIAKAFVSATRTVLPPLRVTAQSGADGSFTIGGLPAATYTLCVAFAGDGYLDPCTWSPPGTTVTVAASQNSTGHVLKIQPGSILKVHLDDPGQLLNQKTKTGYAPHMSIGCARRKRLSNWPIWPPSPWPAPTTRSPFRATPSWCSPFRASA